MKSQYDIVKYDIMEGTNGINETKIGTIPPNPSLYGVNPTLKGKVKHIVKWPNIMLRSECKPVTTFNDNESYNDSLGQLIMDLVVTMNHYQGVGLAANQIGNKYRVLTVMSNTAPIILINPTIINARGKYKTEEGCLSVPGYYENRIRYQTVDVSYVTAYNKSKTVQFQGLASFAVQHEIDHLNGITFVDNLSRLKQDRIKKKITKTTRG